MGVPDDPCLGAQSVEERRFAKPDWRAGPCLNSPGYNWLTPLLLGSGSGRSGVVSLGTRKFARTSCSREQTTELS